MYMEMIHMRFKPCLLAVAAELVAGRRIDAATALGWGLVDALV